MALVTVFRRLCSRGGYNRLLQARFISLAAKFVPDLPYLSAPENHEEIVENVHLRKGHVSRDEAAQIIKDLPLDADRLSPDLLASLARLPNRIHPACHALASQEPKVVANVSGIAPYIEGKDVLSGNRMAEKLAGLREEHGRLAYTPLKRLRPLHGDRSYFLMGSLAALEDALIQYTLQRLTSEFDFSVVSVPDILAPEVVQSCGMNTQGERTQVYRLHPDHAGLALSGTAEMAFGALLRKKVVDGAHKKLCAVSRCYRAEVSDVSEEKGLYRVHHFTKIEMFSACEQAESDEVHAHFLDIQKSLYSDLGLSFVVLDMPPHELGAPAARKWDVEAWLPARHKHGEISSTSNCTDYQARRLAIRTRSGQFAHTVNGTACALPRMILAICEQYQKPYLQVGVPEKLQPFMGNHETLYPPSRPFKLGFAYKESPYFFENHTML